MMKSSKPRTQRRFRFNAPMHQRQHFLNVHLDKALKAKLKLTRRTVQISKGDTVKIMEGPNAGKSGKVVLVSLRRGLIMLDTIVKKSARGKEHPIPINASNVYITDLNLSDKYRAAKLKVAVVPQKKEEKKAVEAKPAAPAPAPAPKVEQKPAIAQAAAPTTTNK